MSDYSKILKRKECQDVMNGNGFDYDQNLRKKLESLELKQSALFREEKWKEWEKVEDAIAETRQKIIQNVNFEVMVGFWCEGRG